MTPGGVLALDLGTETGWAYGPVDRPRPEDAGVWLLAGTRAAKGVGLQRELVAFMDLHAPSQMVIESPLPPQAQTHTESALLLYGLDMVCRIEAYYISCAVTAIDAYTARLEVTGNGTYRGDSGKRELLLFARQRGIKTGKHHVADACILWWWHRQRLNNGKIGGQNNIAV